MLKQNSHTMKELLFTIAFSTLGIISATAQQEVPDTHLTSNVVAARRTEITLPKVNGYTCYKADFHTHTIFSDGDLTPRQRIREAWHDGLDILCLSDHLEYRRQEQSMLNALAPYNADGKPYTYYPANIEYVKSDRTTGVMCNFDAIYDEAKAYIDSEGLPLMLVKGIELSREPFKLGHFSALFVKDISSLYNRDIKQALRNVHAQGGLVIHNHPAYRRTTSDKSKEQAELYNEGLIDGVEIVNDMTFYPKMIRRAIEENLIMLSASDIHRPTAETYGFRGFYRTMTFVMAKECTEEAIREALKERRTIAYSGNQLMGEEKLLADFFNAAIVCQVLHKGKTGVQTLRFRNESSIPFRICYNNAIYEVEPFKSVNMVYKGDAEKPKFTIENMWHIDYQHPEIVVEIDN